MHQQDHNDTWQKPTPEQLPPPTYWPFFLALSVMFIGWGLISIWLLSVAGVIGMIISLMGWIKQMLHDRD